MPEVERAGVRLHYTDEGAGAPVLLVHGHTLDHRVWDGVAPILVGAGRRVIRPDLRGHGASSRPDRGYHPSVHAADMAAVLDGAGLERAAVVGFSLGGGIALEMALATASSVERLVLASPVLPDRPFEAEFFESMRRVASVARREGITAAMLGPWMESPLWGSSLDDPEVRATLTAMLRDFPGADYLATQRDRIERGWTVPDRLGEIAAPTLVMVGAREMAGFKGWAREIASGIPEARLVELDGCGHLHLLEDPERVAGLILDHLAQ